MQMGQILQKGLKIYIIKTVFKNQRHRSIVNKINTNYCDKYSLRFKD